MKAITLADNFAPTWQKLPLQIDREIGAKSKKTKLRHWEAKQTDFLDFEICLTIQQKLSVSLLFFVADYFAGS